MIETKPEATLLSLLPAILVDYKETMEGDVIFNINSNCGGVDKENTLIISTQPMVVNLVTCMRIENEEKHK